MNDENDADKLPELKSLVERYQNTKAPLGFSERVNAHLEDGGHQSWWSDVVANIWSYPKLMAAASVGLVALFSILIIQGTIDNEPQIQIAGQNDDISRPGEQMDQAPIQKQFAQSEKQAMEPLAVEPEQVAQQEEPIKTNPTIAKVAEFDEYSNLAVLSEISQWLDDGTEILTPDLTDIPEFSEIDSLFDTT